MKSKIEKELEQKEFESEIERELRKQELDREYENKLDSDYHPVALGIFNFLMNLTIGYIIYQIFMWFGGSVIGLISYDIGVGIQAIIYIFIIGIALIGAITKKSPWERFLK